MTTQRPPINYTAPTPTFGRWKPWLQAAVMLFAVFGITQLVPVPVIGALGIIPLLAGIPVLWRACLLARDEGREHRADAEEAETGSRPYGYIPPVLPVQASRRPRFWVLVGVVGVVVYIVIAYALIKATMTRHTYMLDGVEKLYRATPNLMVLGILALAFVAFVGYVGYQAVLMHLRATECVPAPFGWWDGAGEPVYDEGLDAQPYDTTAYAPPSTSESSRADAVFAQMRDLTPEELQRFADLLGSEDEDEGAGDAPADDTSPPSEAPRRASGAPDLDSLFGDE